MKCARVRCVRVKTLLYTWCHKTPGSLESRRSVEDFMATPELHICYPARPRGCHNHILSNKWITPTQKTSRNSKKRYIYVLRCPYCLTRKHSGGPGRANSAPQSFTAFAIRTFDFSRSSVYLVLPPRARNRTSMLSFRGQQTTNKRGRERD